MTRPSPSSCGWRCTRPCPPGTPSSTTPRPCASAYRTCWSDPLFLTKGSCTLNFTLNNMHSGSYKAFMFKGGISGKTNSYSGTTTNAPTGQGTVITGGSKPWVSVTGVADNFFYGYVLAETPVVLAVSNSNSPTKLRVTPASGPNRYTFSWNQDAGSTGGKLQWSTDGTTWTTVTAPAGQPLAITKEDVCAGGPAATTGFRTMGAQYSVTVDHTASAGAKISYKVGDSTDTSSVRTFQVPAALGLVNGPQTIIAWADQGFGVDSTTDNSVNGRDYNKGKAAYALSLLAAKHATGTGGATQSQLILISVDVSYADGYLAQWEEYMDMMEPAISSYVLLIGSGNHEHNPTGALPSVVVLPCAMYVGNYV